VTGTSISFEETPPGITETAARIDAAITYLVYERDGEIIGFAYARPFNPRAAYRWACEISIYLDPASHRSGIGRALTTTLLDLLRDRGYVSAIAGITLPNDSSVGLFEALDFTPVGVFDAVGHKLGVWHGVGYWQLQLRAPTTPPPALTSVAE